MIDPFRYVPIAKRDRCVLGFKWSGATGLRTGEPRVIGEDWQRKYGEGAVSITRNSTAPRNS